MDWLDGTNRAQHPLRADARRNRDKTLAAAVRIAGQCPDRGRLFKPAELTELTATRTTVPVPPDSGEPAGTRDDLGLFVNSLFFSGSYRAYGGSGFGYVIRTATTTDGRRSVTVSAHTRPADPQTAARQEDTLRNLIDHAVCHAA